MDHIKNLKRVSRNESSKAFEKLFEKDEEEVSHPPSSSSSTSIASSFYSPYQNHPILERPVNNPDISMLEETLMEVDSLINLQKVSTLLSTSFRGQLESILTESLTPVPDELSFSNFPVNHYPYMHASSFFHENRSPKNDHFQDLQHEQYKYQHEHQQYLHQQYSHQQYSYRRPLTRSNSAPSLLQSNNIHNNQNPSQNQDQISENTIYIRPTMTNTHGNSFSLLNSLYPPQSTMKNNNLSKESFQSNPSQLNIPSTSSPQQNEEENEKTNQNPKTNVEKTNLKINTLQIVDENILREVHFLKKNHVVQNLLLSNFKAQLETLVKRKIVSLNAIASTIPIQSNQIQTQTQNQNQNLDLNSIQNLSSESQERTSPSNSIQSQSQSNLNKNELFDLQQEIRELKTLVKTCLRVSLDTQKSIKKEVNEAFQNYIGLFDYLFIYLFINLFIYVIYVIYVIYGFISLILFIIINRNNKKWSLSSMFQKYY